MVKFVQKKIGCEAALDHPPPILDKDKPVILVSAVALLDIDGRILLAQRPEGKSFAGLWEFPGGKIETGETPEYALMRELEEELMITTRPCCFSPAGFASHTYDDFYLLMPLFICRVWRGVPTPQEGQILKWAYPKDMYHYPMPDADIPLIDQLQQVLS